MRSRVAPVSPRRRMPWLAAAVVLLGAVAARRVDRLTLEAVDFLELPITGTVDGTTNDGSLARVNVLRQEPGGTGRLFINDLNGPVYIYDKKTRALTKYLDFNGRQTRPGLLDRLTFENGFANGFVSFQFDPDYRSNGRFY